MAKRPCLIRLLLITIGFVSWVKSGDAARKDDDSWSDFMENYTIMRQDFQNSSFEKSTSRFTEDDLATETIDHSSKDYNLTETTYPTIETDYTSGFSDPYTDSNATTESRDPSTANDFTAESKELSREPDFITTSIETDYSSDVTILSTKDTFTTESRDTSSSTSFTTVFTDHSTYIDLTIEYSELTSDVDNTTKPTVITAAPDDTSISSEATTEADLTMASTGTTVIVYSTTTSGETTTGATSSSITSTTHTPTPPPNMPPNLGNATLNVPSSLSFQGSAKELENENTKAEIKHNVTKVLEDAFDHTPGFQAINLINIAVLEFRKRPNRKPSRSQDTFLVCDYIIIFDIQEANDNFNTTDNVIDFIKDKVIDSLWNKTVGGRDIKEGYTDRIKKELDDGKNSIRDSVCEIPDVCDLCYHCQAINVIPSCSIRCDYGAQHRQCDESEGEFKGCRCQSTYLPIIFTETCVHQNTIIGSVFGVVAFILAIIITVLTARVLQKRKSKRTENTEEWSPEDDHLPLDYLKSNDSYICPHSDGLSDLSSHRGLVAHSAINEGCVQLEMSPDYDSDCMHGNGESSVETFQDCELQAASYQFNAGLHQME